jgi:hypothetical protein
MQQTNINGIDAMKAVVQNPIQSFNALGRQIFRGSTMALPLFFSVLLFLVFMIHSPYAQSQNTPAAKPDSDARLDVLFDQIMETLPEEKRSRVDSAGSTRPEQRPDSPEASSGNRPEVITPNSARLRQLPQELRVQVERVIADIEQRKEARKERFRESQRKK